MIEQQALTEENLASMNEAQRSIVLRQKEIHNHETHRVDYDVTGEGDYLKDFVVMHGVFSPFTSSAKYHARFLFYNSHYFQDKTVLDIGCGSGILGIVMAKYGANKVIMSDVSKYALENTRVNTQKFGLEQLCDVRKSDLFSNITEKADTIIWNIPFFEGNPPEGDTISASMMMTKELFNRFLIESKNHLNSEGVVLVPSYSLGGHDPIARGLENGYRVKRVWKHNSVSGIQKGWLYIDELTPSSFF
ncbi:MAG: methyltransferase [Candidatus Nanoarchaeia archaeon]